MLQTVLSKKLLRIVKILFFIFIPIIFFYFFSFVEKTFRIKTIIINRNKYELSLYGVDEFKNQNLLLLPESLIANSIQKRNPRIKKVEIEKQYPSTLTLKIDFESDFVNLQTNKGFFILNNKGKILEKTKIINNNLPLITYFQKIDHSSFQPGNLIDYNDILLAIYFVENINKLGRTVNTVDIGSLYMIRFKIEDIIVIFSTEKEKEIQMYELSSILKRYQIEGDKYNTIDLRFDKPILKISD